MIGACVGIKAVPEDMLNTLLTFDCTSNQGIPRPEILNVSKLAVPNI